MLQQRHHRGRREVLGDGRDDEIEERAGRRLGERAAGRVVDADAPGFEAHGDAAREQPVGRDERGGAARRLRRLAQDERDGLGLVLRRRRLDEADAVERARAPRLRRPLAMYCCQRPVVPDGRMASATSAARAVARRRSASAPGSMLHVGARRRRARSSSLASRTADARDARRSPSQLSASRCRSRPGSTMAPCGSRATAPSARPSPAPSR